jgi:hypothetical protein
MRQCLSQNTLRHPLRTLRKTLSERRMAAESGRCDAGLRGTQRQLGERSVCDNLLVATFSPQLADNGCASGGFQQGQLWPQLLTARSEHKSDKVGSWGAYGACTAFGAASCSAACCKLHCYQGNSTQKVSQG